MMEFMDAVKKTARMAKNEGQLLYLYQTSGKHEWLVSEKYWNDWLFKAYPGGRMIFSVAGSKLMPTPPPSDMQKEPK